LWVVEPDELTSLELTGPQLDPGKDRVALIPRTGECGRSAVSGGVVLDGAAASYANYGSWSPRARGEGTGREVTMSHYAVHRFKWARQNTRVQDHPDARVQQAQCHRKCAVEMCQQAANGATCWCDGHFPGFDTAESNALCLPRLHCMELCDALGSNCVGVDVHETLNRCFLQEGILELAPTDDYSFLEKVGVETGARYGWIEHRVCARRNVDVRSPGSAFARVRAEACVAKCRVPPVENYLADDTGNATCPDGFDMTGCTGAIVGAEFASDAEPSCRGDTAVARCGRTSFLEASHWRTVTASSIGGQVSVTCPQRTQLSSCGSEQGTFVAGSYDASVQMGCTFDPGAGTTVAWARCANWGSVQLKQCITNRTDQNESFVGSVAGDRDLCVPKASNCEGHFLEDWTYPPAPGVPELSLTDGDDSDALCVTAGECQELCDGLRAAGEECDGYEVHTSLPRCFLNHQHAAFGASRLGPTRRCIVPGRV